MVECAFEWRRRSVEVGRAAVDKIDVHPAVVIVVEEDAARAYCLRQITLRRHGIIVNPCNAALSGRYFREGDRRRRGCGRSSGLLKMNYCGRLSAKQHEREGEDKECASH